MPNATPAGDTSAVILFHDAGGDRAQTVDALREYIPTMKARGYRFTTVTEGLNRAPSKVTPRGRSRGGAGSGQPEPVRAGGDKWRGAR